jgi:hypothetical protein
VEKEIFSSDSKNNLHLKQERGQANLKDGEDNEVHGKKASKGKQDEDEEMMFGAVHRSDNLSASSQPKNGSQSKAGKTNGLDKK